MTPSWARRLAAATLCLAVVLLPLSAHAQTDTVAAFDEVFRGWMRQEGVRRGVIAIAREGRVVHVTGFDLPADAPVPVASLSKAVTAVCVATLIQRGKLRFDTPLSRALAHTVGRFGPPADPHLADVTIAQLLTHRAGYQRVMTDPVTGTILPNILRVHPARDPAIDAQTRELLRLRLPLAPGERYAYSNAPYLLLGAIVEETTGLPYEDYCRSAVLAPAGAPTASLTPDWRILSSYGGWQFTAREYLRFHEVFGPRGPVLSDTTRQWMLAPDDKVAGGGAHYGLGALVRHAAGSYNVWHDGRWRYQLQRSADTTLSVDYGSYVARLGEAGFSWFAYFEPSPPDRAVRELGRRMYKTGRESVKHWP
ncbi:MAG TPA: serine hydrolase domain-containing protein [Vineibacter sp.]|nr:serine hydrolase domain-containing protein [Vineibacter sp.]